MRQGRIIFTSIGGIFQYETTEELGCSSNRSSPGPEEVKDLNPLLFEGSGLPGMLLVLTCPTEQGPEHQRKAAQIPPWGRLLLWLRSAAGTGCLGCWYLALKWFCLSAQELIVYMKPLFGKALAVPHLLAAQPQHPSSSFLSYALLGTLGTGAEDAAAFPSRHLEAVGCSPPVPSFPPHSGCKFKHGKCFAPLISAFPAFGSWFKQERLTKARPFT